MAAALSQAKPEPCVPLVRRSAIATIAERGMRKRKSAFATVAMLGSRAPTKVSVLTECRLRLVSRASVMWATSGVAVIFRVTAGLSAMEMACAQLRVSACAILALVVDTVTSSAMATALAMRLVSVSVLLAIVVSSVKSSATAMAPATLWVSASATQDSVAPCAQ